ncbi:MAG: conjugal transfer protein TrbL, partial [Salinibacterium sp.]|nr:conjugal transfer protein TrbL [Salinibacterium sp.]
MSTLFAILHVATAVFIVGPMAILPMTAMRSLRAGQGGQVRTLAKSTTVFTLLSLIPFLIGFGLMGMYKIPFDRTWIWLSIVL